MNSAAAIKAFCGERGGLVCTSSNARASLSSGPLRAASKILFLPDQHLGRNTGFAMGIPLERDGGVGSVPDQRRRRPRIGLKAAKVILWKGHCSVHQRFLPSHVDQVRAKYPGMQVIVHPECRWEVCQKADALGSTERMIEVIEKAPAGSSFAVGTEIHLVNRLAQAVCSAGQAHHHARRHRLPVHDDVPHQPAAPGVGAGKSGRRTRGQSHQGGG